MGRRARKSEFEHSVEALARLPWQVCLVLALASFVGFHLLSRLPVAQPSDIGQLGTVAGTAIFRTVGLFMQFLAPAACLLAALGSWIGQRRRATLLQETESRTSAGAVRELSWQQFEQLVGAHFERQGYSVQFTRAGADGGVDAVVRKGRETFLIQCKQWRATQVGVSVVRELFGVMSARGATGGYIVSIGTFTRDAIEFAAGRNIELVDANRLLRPGDAAPGLQRPAASAAPQCPKCGAVMVLRTARQGANRGQSFFGCSTFPQCRATLPAE